jgi:hypothetical protein
MRFKYPQSKCISHGQAQQDLPYFVCKMAPVCQSGGQLNGGSVQCGHKLVLGESLLCDAKDERDSTEQVAVRKVWEDTDVKNFRVR